MGGETLTRAMVVKVSSSCAWQRGWRESREELRGKPGFFYNSNVAYCNGVQRGFSELLCQNLGALNSLEARVRGLAGCRAELRAAVDSSDWWLLNLRT